MARSKKGGDEQGDAKKAKQEKADKKDRQRLANMFAKNAAAAAGGVKRNRPSEAKQPEAGAMDADDLLESILAGVGGDDAPARLATRPAPAAFPANQFRRPAPAQPPSRGAHAGGHGARRRDPAAPRAAGAPASAGATRRRVTLARRKPLGGGGRRVLHPAPLAARLPARRREGRRAHARG